MSGAKRLFAVLAEVALLNVLFMGAGLALLTAWARLCSRIKRRQRDAL